MFACQAKCRRFESDYPLQNPLETFMNTIDNEPLNTLWNLKVHRYPPWIYMSNVFDKSECENIVSIMSRYPSKEASILQEIKDDNVVRHQFDNKVRKNRISWVPAGPTETDWIFRKLTDVIIELNKQFYNFDLDYIESLQYTIYNQIGDHYIAHEDFRGMGAHYRKFSFSVQLSDPETYEGCDLMIHKMGFEFAPTKREQGTMVAFPSYSLHQVTPLVKGTRISLVGWVCGQPFK